MTAIAAVKADGKIWMGGDSAGVAHYHLHVRSDPKVFRLGEMLFGYTSSFRMGQIIQYHLRVEKPREDEDRHRYMVCTMIPAVRAALKEQGFLKTENGREEIGTFLVGWRGELYIIEDDMQVAMLHEPYAAVGCGQDLVLGSLHTTEQLDGPTPRERIEYALDAAVAFSAGVRGPFTILKT